ncbi:MAG: hypothetical protein IK130_00960 [Oscillospiraceae bacterium]|nr:hypothetical protein [Oscillospiraceae bacterium]
MDDKDLDALLSELRSDKRSVHERLTDLEEIPEISEDLTEDIPQEIPEIIPETVPEEIPDTLSKDQSAPYRAPSRTKEAVIGGILVIFALIGVIAAVRHCAGLIGRFRTAHAPETAVERRLLPLVLMDIPDFDSPDALNDEMFLTAAIWDMAVSGRLADYPETYGMCTVPQADVIAAGNALFASSRTPVCKTIGFTGDLRFYYDAEQSAYVLPQDPVLFTYIPAVSSLTEAEGIYTAQVDYFAEQPQWKQETEHEPVKTVSYTLRKSDSGWQVLSAKLSDSAVSPT